MKFLLMAVLMFTIGTTSAQANPEPETDLEQCLAKANDRVLGHLMKLSKGADITDLPYTDKWDIIGFSEVAKCNSTHLNFCGLDVALSYRDYSKCMKRELLMIETRHEKNKIQAIQFTGPRSKAWQWFIHSPYVQVCTDNAEGLKFWAKKNHYPIVIAQQRCKIVEGKNLNSYFDFLSFNEPE